MTSFSTHPDNPDETGTDGRDAPADPGRPAEFGSGRSRDRCRSTNGDGRGGARASERPRRNTGRGASERPGDADRRASERARGNGGAADRNSRAGPRNPEPAASGAGPAPEPTGEHPSAPAETGSGHPSAPAETGRARIRAHLPCPRRRRRRPPDSTTASIGSEPAAPQDRASGDGGYQWVENSARRDPQLRRDGQRRRAQLRRRRLSVVGALRRNAGRPAASGQRPRRRRRHLPMVRAGKRNQHLRRDGQRRRPQLRRRRLSVVGASGGTLADPPRPDNDRGAGDGTYQWSEPESGTNIYGETGNGDGRSSSNGGYQWSEFRGNAGRPAASGQRPRRRQRHLPMVRAGKRNQHLRRDGQWSPPDADVRFRPLNGRPLSTEAGAPPYCPGLSGELRDRRGPISGRAKSAGSPPPRLSSIRLSPLAGRGLRTSGLAEVRSLMRKPGTPGLRRQQACAAGEGEEAVQDGELHRVERRFLHRPLTPASLVSAAGRNPLPASGERRGGDSQARRRRDRALAAQNPFTLNQAQALSFRAREAEPGTHEHRSLRTVARRPRRRAYGSRALLRSPGMTEPSMAHPERMLL